MRHSPLHFQRTVPVTPIPYRIMLPQPVENLICPGRAVSVECDVLGPLRVMAMGEAVGVVAAQVAARAIPFARIEMDALRAALRAQGALVDMSAIARHE